MEAVTAPLDYLLWVLTPAGAVVAISLSLLVVTGWLGRVLPTIELSASGRRPTRRERITR